MNSPFFLVTNAKLQAHFAVVANSHGSICKETLTLKDHLDFTGLTTGEADAKLPCKYYFLAYNNQYRNYYHFMIEWLGSIFLYLRCLNTGSIDNSTILLLPSPESVGFLEPSLLLLLNILDLNEKNLRLKGDEVIVGISNLYVPKILFGHSAFSLEHIYFDDFSALLDKMAYIKYFQYCNSTDNSFAASREAAIGLCKLPSFQYDSPPEILYISRVDSRNRSILNENKVINILHRDYGASIVTFSSKTLFQQASLMSSASIVVSPHGAALANLAFCKNSKLKYVIELQPESYQNTCFYVISKCLGISHSCILMKEIDSLCEDNTRHQQEKSFEADVDGLTSEVDRILQYYWPAQAP